MKIWRSFAADHSARLRIIGTFKTAKNAKEAADTFNDFLSVEHKEKGTSYIFSDEMMEAFKRHNFHSFSEHDPEQLDLFDSIEPEENKVVVETNEVEIQALLKVFLENGAKIEIYSMHDYPGS